MNHMVSNKTIANCTNDGGTTAAGSTHTVMLTLPLRMGSYSEACVACKAINATRQYRTGHSAFNKACASLPLKLEREMTDNRHVS